MTINYQRLKARVFPEIHHTYLSTDCQLYALSLGIGDDPVDPDALSYVYEGVTGGLRVIPTMATVLGYPGYWVREPDSGIDWKKMVHGEQRMVCHRPLPSGGVVMGKNQVTHVVDKGEGRGAIVVVERSLHCERGAPLATLRQVMFCRGDGGFGLCEGGQPSDALLPPLMPTPEDRPPDRVNVHTTRPDAALLYRLLGDVNPLHADPVVAKAAGFDRPILHGLATYGMAAYALIRQCTQKGAFAHLRRMDARFASPVYPGETLQTDIWETGPLCQFRVRAVERDVIVLSHGNAEWA